MTEPKKQLEELWDAPEERLASHLEQVLVSYDEDAKLFGASGAGAYFLADYVAKDLAGGESIDLIFEHLGCQVAEVNAANGWYDAERTFGDDIALLHSEVSEALEAFRSWGLDDATLGEAIATEDGPVGIPKPQGVGSELADVLIRLLDTAHRRGIDLGAEYRRKLAYNRTRSHRHGGKRL